MSAMIVVLCDLRGGIIDYTEESTLLQELEGN